MIFVDAEKKVLGRIASFAAKKALQGEQVVVVNAEKAIITGSRESAMQRLKTRLDLHSKGNPEKGPHFSRMPDRILRIAIRGMLPWKSSRGKQAFSKVQVFIGLPDEFSEKKFAEIAAKKERQLKRFVQLGVICRLLGAKW